MKILVTGASGLIGKQLMPMLRTAGYEPYGLSRRERPGFYKWDIKSGYIDEKAFENLHAIIHLAGEPVAQRWNKAAKQRILQSRTQSSELLLEKCKVLCPHLEVFISASGSNYYGTQTVSGVMTEEQNAADDFLGKVCKQWEKGAYAFKDLGARVVCLRTGIVLAKKGGALPKMLPPFKFGIGSPIGTGKQAMPIVHVQDLCRMYVMALQNSAMQGAYNAVADSPSNAAFSEELAKAIQRPFFFPNVPAFILKLIFGEMADILLEGSKLSNAKVKKAGFIFSYPNAKSALNQIFGNSDSE